MELDRLVDLAESLERTRYELMRSASWEDLRASERAIRVELAGRVLEESGITRLVDELLCVADRVPTLEREAARAHEQLTARTEQHAVALAEREGRIAALEREVEQLRDALTLAQGRAEEAEARVSAVRGLLAGEGGAPGSSVWLEVGDDGARASVEGVTGGDRPAQDGAACPGAPVPTAQAIRRRRFTRSG